MTTARLENQQATPEPRNFWFRPFCLSCLVLVLLNMLIIGVIIVLLVRQVITIPAGILSAFTGQPAPTIIQGTTVLERVQSLSELVTTRYNYSSLVTSNRDMPDILGALYGDKLIMVAVGEVDAGIDLHKVQITGDGNNMTITLPPPELQTCTLDEKDSYVVSRETGLFAKPAPNLDQEARRFAIAQFRDSAINSDIYSQVQTKAQTVIGDFVSGLGVKKFNILTTPPDPNAALPETCQGNSSDVATPGS